MIIKKRGFTLVETLFYIAGLVVLLLVIATLLFYMYEWHRNMTIAPRVDRVGISLVDKIVRDIRASGTINSAQSSFNTTNGSFSITGTVNSTSVTRKFSLSNGYLTYQQDTGAISYLSPNGMTVTRLYLTSTSSPISSAIKFDIDIAYKTKQGTTTKTYSGFSILRQSYE